MWLLLLSLLSSSYGEKTTSAPYLHAGNETHIAKYRFMFENRTMFEDIK